MKEFTLVNDVKINPDQTAHFPSALQNLDDFAVERRFGNTTPLKKLLDDNKTDAFVVVHNGQLVYERYFNGYKQNEPHGMASLAKVFTGAIIQSLAEENRIDLEKTADTYIKELKKYTVRKSDTSAINGHASFSRIPDPRI